MIIFTGESHLGAIARSAPETRVNATFWPLGKGSMVKTPFFEHDVATKTVRTVADGWRNRVFSKETLTFNGSQALIALSMPLNTSRVFRDYSWNTHVPWQLQKTKAEIALSDTVVDTLFAQDYGYVLKFVTALQACDISVVAIEGPRFFGIAPYLKRHRFDVCAYIDAHYRKTVKAKLFALGVDVVEQPPKTVTDRGTTDVAFSREDPKDTYHANEKFGSLMFEEVITYAKTAGYL